MKHNTILRSLVLSASLAITHSALADPDLDDLDDLIAKANPNAVNANLSTSAINGKGTITYNGNQVWQGPVKKDLKAFSKVVSSDENGEKKDIEYAAIWDGNKLVWQRPYGCRLSPT